MELDEALDAGLAEVPEISNGGSVPELLFRNKPERDILLVDDEELIGAKQNRGLNLTIFVGGWQDVKIPASCVEASERSRHVGQLDRGEQTTPNEGSKFRISILGRGGLIMVA